MAFIIIRIVNLIILFIIRVILRVEFLVKIINFKILINKI